MRPAPEWILGFDPGKTGGYAAIHIPTGSARAHTIPVAGKEIDWHELAHELEAFTPGIAYVEKVSARPGQGVSSMFSFGKSTGVVYGILAAQRTPIEIVTPQRWKKLVLRDTPKDKAAAIAFCARRYPDVSLLPTALSRKAHDGMADALCIAHYGLMIERGEEAA